MYPRKSNTEAVIGVYSEANTHEKAQLIALEVSALVL